MVCSAANVKLDMYHVAIMGSVSCDKDDGRRGWTCAASGRSHAGGSSTKRAISPLFIFAFGLLFLMHVRRECLLHRKIVSDPG